LTFLPLDCTTFFGYPKKESKKGATITGNHQIICDANKHTAHAIGVGGVFYGLCEDPLDEIK